MGPITSRTTRSGFGECLELKTRSFCLKHRVHQRYTKNRSVLIDSISAKYVGARGGSRTRTPRRARDFKSPAYAIPPPGHCACKPNSLSHLLQDLHFLRGGRDSAGVSSGVNWFPCGSVQSLDGGQRVLRCKVTIPHRHGDRLMTE
jgi:hypothetical protein